MTTSHIGPDGARPPQATTAPRDADASECPAWAWHACACPQQCDPEPKEAPMPESTPRPDDEREQPPTPITITPSPESIRELAEGVARVAGMISGQDREGAPRLDDVPDEWVTAAQQADAAHARTRRPDGAGWTRTPDDQVRRILAAVAPLIERQVAAETVLIAPDDLAALLGYVVGGDNLRFVYEDVLGRAFAALEAHTARGEGR